MKPPTPPPFEILEKQQAAPMQVQPPPPSFDVVEDIFQHTPSAAPPPPMEHAPDLLFDGLTPMAPPPFESTMHQHVQETTGLMDGSDMVEPEGFDFDVDGNHLSSEEKRKMIEEQRAIMEQIQKQAGQNAASEAAVRADAFEQRSNIAAAAAVGRGTPPPNMIGMEDLSQFDADRRLAEQLQRQLNGGNDEVAVSEYIS